MTQKILCKINQRERIHLCLNLMCSEEGKEKAFSKTEFSLIESIIWTQVLLLRMKPLGIIPMHWCYNTQTPHMIIYNVPQFFNYYYLLKQKVLYHVYMYLILYNIVGWSFPVQCIMSKLYFNNVQKMKRKRKAKYKAYWRLMRGSQSASYKLGY